MGSWARVLVYGPVPVTVLKKIRNENFEIFDILTSVTLRNASRSKVLDLCHDLIPSYIHKKFQVEKPKKSGSIIIIIIITNNNNDKRKDPHLHRWRSIKGI